MRSFQARSVPYRKILLRKVRLILKHSYKVILWPSCWLVVSVNMKYSSLFINSLFVLKRKDSFPYCIDHFMQVTAEGRLRWTFSFSGNHLEVCSFNLVNYYFSLPINISSFNSTSPPKALWPLSLTVTVLWWSLRYNLWTALILTLSIVASVWELY